MSFPVSQTGVAPVQSSSRHPSGHDCVVKTGDLRTARARPMASLGYPTGSDCSNGESSSVVMRHVCIVRKYATILRK